MKCPRCESTQFRKNGRSNGKQRYLCKACGKQFLEPLSSPELPNVASNTLEVHTNGYSETALVSVPSLLNPPDASVPLLTRTVTPTLSPRRISILLLDAENLRLDINAEKFLAEVSNYPLQVKLAFANWRNPAIGKLDAELYERGYQLIHVPLGQNSADAQMIAMGVSISRHYPDAEEVFVCSSDWLLTHLCNELQSQGMLVYRVRRQNNTLRVENRYTGETREYSLTRGTEIPSYEEFVNKINELINAEQESLTERMERLSTVAALFQERCLITQKDNRTIHSLVGSQNQGSMPSGAEQELIPPPPEKENVESNGSVTILSNPSIKSIHSREEFERTLVKIITAMKANSSLDKVPVTKLSAALQIVCGETANAVIKKLKLGGNFTKFLQSCALFTVEKAGSNAEVSLSENSFPEITS